MKIAVFGTGAVGGYFGGRLAEAGQEVWFVARGAHLAAIREHGLHVTSIKGDFVIHPAHATDKPADVGVVDVVLVAVKTWQVDEAAHAIQPMIGPATMVVPLQNGVEAAGQLKAVLGDKPVVGGFCRILSAMTGPGQIHHMASEPYIAFAELDNQSSARTQRLYEAFTAAGVKCEIPADIELAVWEKFLFVAAWGGVGAITRAPIGTLRSIPETRRMLEHAMAEIYAIGRARGVKFEPDILGQTMTAYDNLAAAGTTSMQRDIAEGRPSELEGQIGAIVRLGRDCRVPTPVNELIYHALLPMEKRARGEVNF
ncbi:MAG: 2-dehydropantoate 2-reductase [Chloroflexi bacterium]|nr:2-dehydropantoate 2-reductase [Chloroflexota bacterium]